MKMVLLTALGVGGATLIGSILGFIFKKISHRFSDMVLSFAAGVMLAAAVLGLIIPSLDYGGKYAILITVAGIFTGAIALNVIDKIVPHLHKLVLPVPCAGEQREGGIYRYPALFPVFLADGVDCGRQRQYGDGGRRYCPAEYT